MDYIKRSQFIEKFKGLSIQIKTMLTKVCPTLEFDSYQIRECFFCLREEYLNKLDKEKGLSVEHNQNLINRYELYKGYSFNKSDYEFYENLKGVNIDWILMNLRNETL